jgi:hypothetical protein
MGTSRKDNSIQLLELFLFRENSRIRLIKNPCVCLSVKYSIKKSFNMNSWQVPIFDWRLRGKTYGCKFFCFRNFDLLQTINWLNNRRKIFCLGKLLNLLFFDLKKNKYFRLVKYLEIIRSKKINKIKSVSNLMDFSFNYQTWKVIIPKLMVLVDC